MKKIFIALSLFIPLFCWAGSNPLTILVGGMASIKAPKDISLISTADNQIILKTNDGKLFSYATVYMSDYGVKESSYDFYHKSFSDPQSEKQKETNNFYKNKVTIKKNDYTITVAKAFDKNVAFVYSKKMPFAVEILYPLESKDYFSEIEKVSIRGSKN